MPGVRSMLATRMHIAHKTRLESPEARDKAVNESMCAHLHEKDGVEFALSEFFCVYV